jgi:hypothetical protein
VELKAVSEVDTVCGLVWMGPIMTHPINKRYCLLWCKGTELSVMKTACRQSWCSWRISSSRMATTSSRSTEPSIAIHS